MTKNELITRTALISGMSAKDVAHALNTAGDVVAVALAEEGEAVLPGIGKLVASLKAARVCRNPMTGSAIQIPARTVVKFRVGKFTLQLLCKARVGGCCGGR